MLKVSPYWAIFQYVLLNMALFFGPQKSEENWFKNSWSGTVDSIWCLLSYVFSVPSSRSIVQINVSLSFQPHSINVIQKTCQRAGRESACLNATACFTTVSRSPGPHSNSFGITLYVFSDLKFIGLPSLIPNKMLWTSIFLICLYFCSFVTFNTTTMKCLQ